MIIQVKHCHPLTNKLERIYDDFLQSGDPFVYHF